MRPTPHFHSQWTIEFPIDSYRGCLAFSPTEHLLAVVEGMTERDRYGAIQKYPGSEIIRVRDTSTGQAVYSLTGHSDRVSNLLFIPDGQHLISSGNDDTIRVWDLSAQCEMHVMRGHEGIITALALSPDKQWLVSSSCNRYIPGDEPGFEQRITSDRSIRVWDWRKGVEVAPPTTEIAGTWNVLMSTSHVAFCADGETLLSTHVGRDQQESRLWHFPSQKQIGSLQVARAFWNGWIDYNRHQTLLYSQGGIYCLESDKYIFKLNLSRNQSVCGYTVDLNRRLFVASIHTMESLSKESFELSVWHLDSGQRIGSLNQDFARGERFAFSPDGHLLVGWLCLFRLPGAKNKLQVWKVTDV